jgi:maleylacetate reductase
VRPFVYDARPGRVVFGSGASREKRLAGGVDRLVGERILLIATEGERALAGELAAPLEARIAGVSTGVRPHVPVEDAGALAPQTSADCPLPVVGGSTTGTAKAVAPGSKLPVVAVPTTCAGSEMTPIRGMAWGRRRTNGAERSA